MARDMIMLVAIAFLVPVCVTGSAGAQEGQSQEDQSQEDQSQEKPTEAQPPPATASEEKGRIYEQLKLMDVAELMQRVEHARNALSRDGQAALKDRAVVRLVREKAATIVQRYETDAAVQHAAQVLETTDVKQELARLLEVPDKAQMSTQFAAFLERRGLNAGALQGLVALRDARAVSKGCDETIRLIDEYLERRDMPVIGPSRTTAEDLRAALDPIRQKYGGGKKAPGSELPRSGDAQDLVTLLQALLRPPESERLSAEGKRIPRRDREPSGSPFTP